MKFASVVFALASLLAGTSMAGPVLDFDFVNSGQILSPTDQVVVRGRITNIGDETFPAGGTIGTGFLRHGRSITDQYWFATLDDWPEFWPPGAPALAPGDSVEWTFVTYTPWPLGQPIGSPVPEGVYTILPSQVQFATSQFAPDFTLIRYTALVGPEDSFTWTVRAPSASVSSPGTLASIGLGLVLIGIGGLRRSLED